MTTHTPTPKSLKRNYQRMMMDQHCQGMVPVDYYNEFPPGVFYTPPPPPPQHVLFSNPFPSPYEYCSTPDGYLPSSSGESTGYFAGHRSLSEPFAPGADSSFSSGSSSCNASVGPATPPPTQTPGGHPRYSSGQLPKFPAIPITPSHVVPRQKAKRTATACEECRKRKQKCDGEHVCQSCKEQKLECKYREVLPTKKDNSMEKLVGLIESFGKSMEALNQRLDAMSATVGSIQARLDQHQTTPAQAESLA